MAEQKMSDTLFEAMDIIINKRIEAVGKDKTILCVVEDNSKAEQGEYTVSNTSTKFTAYSENPKYTVGQNVWVLIPEGDYNKEKKILGKHVGSSNTPYIYVDPLASYVDMTGNVLHDAQQFSGENGLIANYSHPVDIFTGESVGTSNLTWDNTKQKWVADVFTIDDLLLNNVGLGLEHLNHKQFPDYDCVGISADFSTNFGTNIPISGTYGLRFELIIAVPAEQVKSGEDETDLATYYNFVSFPITLDSANMWGNPYNYATPTTQTIRYKLPLDAGGNVLGIPIGIHGYFYQNFDFKDQNNGEYPFYSAVEFNGAEPVYTSQQRPDLASPNIFVKDICVSFGYAVEKVEDDTLFLFTTSSDTYIVDNDDYNKNLQVRYVYADDNQTKIAINSWADLNGRIQEIPELKALAPIIHWYRYRLIEGVQDLRAGNLWEEFYPSDMFFTTIDNWENIAEEKFKCILCYNNKFAYYIRSYVEALRREGKTGTPHYNHYFSLWEWWYGTICGANNTDSDFDEKFPYNAEATSDDIWEQWCKTDQRIESKELIFTNKANAYDTTQDFIQGLRLEAADRSNGVFNIYEATYGANNNLINSSDEHIARKVKATFWSAVTKEDEMNKVERLAWYVPKHNTMIKKPEDGSSYGAYTKIELTADTYTPGVYYTRNLTTYTLSDDRFNPEVIYYEKGQEKFFATEEDLNDAIENGDVDLSEEEINLFKTRLLSYYIVLEDDIQETAEKINEATLVYYIKPELKKHWTNNTILASAYRYHRIYEGEKAKFTPIFGAKGTNGTDYTLSLQMVSDIGANGTEYQNPPAWTWNPSNKNGNNTIVGDATASMQLNAQLFDADDVEVTTATYTWSFLFPENGKINNDIIWTWDERGSNVQNPVLLPSSLFNNYSNDPMTIGHYEGVILKCEARLINETFTGYLIVPMRRSRAYIGIQGPSIVRYSSSGTGAQYYDAPYGLLDVDENILYTTIDGDNEIENKVSLVTFNDSADNGVKVSSYAAKYLPTVAKKTNKDDHYHLYPKAMFFNNVVYRAFIKIHRGTDSAFLWGQPLLIIVDPYGNKFLNNWGGGLDIDYDNNTIMSAVMGAGKKEANNSFTGLLLGNLPEVTQEGVDNQGHPIMVDKTGLVGYEHGEQAYGIFDDGTMFLGKASRAQIRLNGTEGVIQNANYPTSGIKIDFEGDNQKPYIDLQANTGAQVYLGTGGAPTINLYFRVKSPNTDNGGNNQELIHIGKQEYYLQTDNYADPVLYQNGDTIPEGSQVGDIKTVGSGLKINLKDGTLTGYDKLIIQGGIPGESNSILLSTEDSPIKSLAGQSGKNNWRLAIGPNFGVDANGNMFATNGNLTGKIIANEGTIGGLTISNSTNTAINGGHFYKTSLFAHATDNSYQYEIGMKGSNGPSDLAFYVKRKALGSNWEDTNVTDVFFVRNNGAMKATSGTVGGWNITDDSLYNGNTHLYSSGRIKGASISGATITGSKITIGGSTQLDDNTTVSGTLNFSYGDATYSLAGGKVSLSMGDFGTKTVNGVYTSNNLAVDNDIVASGGIWSSKLTIKGATYFYGSVTSWGGLNVDAGQFKIFDSSEEQYVTLTSDDIMHLHTLWTAYINNGYSL